MENKYYTQEIEDLEIKDIYGAMLARGDVFDYLNINMNGQGYQIVPYEILKFLAKYRWDVVSIGYSDRGILQTIVAKRKNYGK